MKLFRMLMLSGLLLPSLVRSATVELDDFLAEGKLADGLAAFARPSDDAGRFSLAVLQTLSGVQKFCAGFYQIGQPQSSVRRFIPFLRVPPDQVAPTSRNASTTPEQVRRLFVELRADLRQANTTLAGLKGEDFGVRVDLSRVRIDFDGDGFAAPEERLAVVLGQTFRMRQGNGAEADLVIRFDAADAVWLDGYTHVLPGALDLFLSYDWMPVWNRLAHHLFKSPDPMPPLAPFSVNDQYGEWADLIAALHDMRLELIDPAGPRRARDEFRAMIATSRICWKKILEETDDEGEWLPAPRQTGPLGARVTQQELDGWLLVLDELDAILVGKKLLPHWRMKPGTGIQLEKLVANPPPLDMVLMLQGSSFIPYLEEGPVSDRRSWETLLRAFNAGFMRFAVWSN
jgi:hypothetical protein